MWCFPVSVGAVHSDCTVSVVNFDIAGTLKQNVGVTFPAYAAPPLKGDWESMEILAVDRSSGREEITSIQILDTLSTAKANRSGPSGPPCWLPVSMRIASLPITRWLLVAYKINAIRRIDGTLDEQTSRK